MAKAIIVLDGVSEGKNIFADIVMNENHKVSSEYDGYWTWQTNHKNRLASLAYKMGWDGERNKRFYEFLAELENLTNSYFDFEENYIGDVINNFATNDKPQVLIIHNANDKLKKALNDDPCTNSFAVLISDSDIRDDRYSKVLNYNSPTFKDDVLSLLRILTKDFECKK